MPGFLPCGPWGLPYSEVLVILLDARDAAAVDEADFRVLPCFGPLAIDPFAPHPSRLVAGGDAVGVDVDTDRKAHHACHRRSDDERLLEGAKGVNDEGSVVGEPPLWRACAGEASRRHELEPRDEPVYGARLYGEWEHAAHGRDGIPLSVAHVGLRAMGESRP